MRESRKSPELARVIPPRLDPQTSNRAKFLVEVYGPLFAALGQLSLPAPVRLSDFVNERHHQLRRHYLGPPLAANVSDAALTDTGRSVNSTNDEGSDANHQKQTGDRNHATDVTVTDP